MTDKPIKNWSPDKYKTPESKMAAYRKAREKIFSPQYIADLKKP
jgi:hypothetical protein